MQPPQPPSDKIRLQLPRRYFRRNPPLSGMFWTDPETVLDPPTTTQDTGPDSPGRDRSDTPLRSAADDESVHSHGRTPVRAQSRSFPFSDSLTYSGLRNKTVPLTSDALCLLHYGSNLFYFRIVEISIEFSRALVTLAAAAAAAAASIAGLAHGSRP